MLENKAVDLLKEWMPGTRNDGFTPSWQHPVNVMNVFDEMVSSTGTLYFGDTKQAEENTKNVFRIICLLHDILEDGKKDGKEFTENDLASFLGYNFATHMPLNAFSIFHAVVALTKTGNTSFGTMGLVDYFVELSKNDKASIVKCCDRISNLREAEGVFKPYRLERYKWETKMLVVPLLDDVTGCAMWCNWLRNELIELSYTEHQPRKKKQ